MDHNATDAFSAEVRSRFGVLPNFFCTAASAPGLIQQLWGFAKAGYLDNPLPSLFMNHGLVRWPLCCAIAHTLVGCAMLTPEWHPHRASASACPDSSMEMCVIDNYGKRCGCASAATTDAMKRSSR